MAPAPMAGGSGSASSARMPSMSTRMTSVASAATGAAGKMYNVRLDQPAGDGVSYAPDALASSHNTAKRLFLPAPISLAASSPGGASSSGSGSYDFRAEIAAKRRERQSAFKLGDYDGDELAEYELEDDDYRFDATSFIAPSVRSAAPSNAHKNSDNVSINSLASVRSNMTASQLYAASSAAAGKLPPPSYNVSTRLPPSISKSNAKTPWDAPVRTNAAILDRITRPEREAGRAKDRWQEMNERGNVPLELGAGGRMAGANDGASLSGSDTASIRTNADLIRVADLFVPDPRPWRPLRMVRRTDPRQVLLLTHGLLVRDQVTGAITGGIGVDFCPSHFRRGTTKRTEKNLSHALEKPPDPILLQNPTLTPKRAALRAALAALEYADWYEEGFDQVVVGVAHDWLVKGISSDIFQWKVDGWLVKGAAGAELGVDPGERVPDRDLWELLDDTVRAYEKLDCNVRFWRVSKDDLETAKELAVAGAANETPRPETVRWRKKPRNLIDL